MLNLEAPPQSIPAPLSIALFPATVAFINVTADRSLIKSPPPLTLLAKLLLISTLLNVSREEMEYIPAAHHEVLFRIFQLIIFESEFRKYMPPPLLF